MIKILNILYIATTAVCMAKGLNLAVHANDYLWVCLYFFMASSWAVILTKWEV